MKPLGRKAYGSIPHLPGSRLGSGDHHCHEGQATIATKSFRDRHDSVIVQEKLDGSNVAVCKVDNRIIPLTRAGYKALSSPYEQHHKFDKWVMKNYAAFDLILKEGQRISGEWLAMAHGTRYDLAGKPPFVAFDMFDADNYRFDFATFANNMHLVGITIPKSLRSVIPVSIESALKFVSESGHGAIDPVEGAIWRVERKGVVDFLVKYVRQDKEDGKYFPEVTGGETVWNCVI